MRGSMAGLHSPLRGVAQPGSARPLGGRGPRFKSGRPDWHRRGCNRVNGAHPPCEAPVRCHAHGCRGVHAVRACAAAQVAERATRLPHGPLTAATREARSPKPAHAHGERSPPTSTGSAGPRAGSRFRSMDRAPWARRTSRLRAAPAPPRSPDRQLLGVHRDSINRCIEPEGGPRPPAWRGDVAEAMGMVNSAARRRGSHPRASPADPPGRNWREVPDDREPSRFACHSPPEPDLDQRRREKRVKAHRRQTKRDNRRRQRAGHRDRLVWRAAPATPDQLAALRTLATATGTRFTTGITRGDAWRRIRRANALLDQRLRSKCSPPWWTPPKADRR
jgi:hypothetical protein